MMKVFDFRSVLVGMMALAVFGLQSCSKDAESPEVPADARLTQTDLKTVLETDQRTGAVDDILAELFQNGPGSSAKFTDDSCYRVTYTETGFTVVFENCLLNQTEMVDGTLEVVHNEGTGAATFTATYKGFFVGMAEVNGTRTFTVTESGDNSYAFSVVSSMTVILADGRTLTESGTRTLQFRLGDTLADISFSISGNWEISEDDTLYTATVVSPLNGNLSCGYPVSGVVEISKNGLQVSVDFGDGTCDNTITVIYPNGATEDLSL